MNFAPGPEITSITKNYEHWRQLVLKVQCLFSGIYFDVPQDCYFPVIIPMTFHNPQDNNVFENEDYDKQ